jgi:hypothetical protein
VHISLQKPTAYRSWFRSELSEKRSISASSRLVSTCDEHDLQLAGGVTRRLNERVGTYNDASRLDLAASDLTELFINLKLALKAARVVTGVHAEELLGLGCVSS